MFLWFRMLRKLFASFLSSKSALRFRFGLLRERPKARRPRPAVRLGVEGLGERILPSASPVADFPSAMVSTMNQVDHLIVTLQNDVSSVRQAIVQQIAQETAYIQQQVDQLLGIAPSNPTSSPTPSVPPSGNSGSGSGSGATTTAHNASNTPLAPSAPKASSGSGTGATTTSQENGAKQVIRPMVGSGSSGSFGSSGSTPGGSLVSGSGSSGSVGGTGSGSSVPPGNDYEWAPEPSHAGSGLGSSGSYVGNLNANNWHNWWKNGFPQNEYNHSLPGSMPGDSVTFGYYGAGSLGKEPIIWNQNFVFSNEADSNYNNVQTIATGETVEVTGKDGKPALQMDGSDTLSLDFASNTSRYVIDGTATITNLTTAGNKGGSFMINGGTTTIAGGNYTDLIGTRFVIGQNATLKDLGKCPLTFTQNSLGIKVYGTMGVNNSGAGMTLIGTSNGIGLCYVDVYGGKLIYSGKAGVTDTFGVPVGVRDGGTFALMGPAPNQNGGTLIVKGSAVPTNLATGPISVAMAGTGSSIQLSQKSTLECDNIGYAQTGGTLETTDGGVNNASTLQVGPAGTGRVDIEGGNVTVAAGVQTFPNEFDVKCGNMNLGAATLNVGVDGTTNGSNDLLKVIGNLNINNPANSFLTVTVSTGGKQLVTGKSWIIIDASNQLNAFLNKPPNQNITFLNTQGWPFNAQANNPNQGSYKVSF